MRILLLLCFTSLLHGSAQSQSFFTTAPQRDFKSTTNRIIKATATTYFVAGGYGGSNTNHTPQIFCIDSAGNILFEKHPFAGSTMSVYNVTDILKTADGNFVCVGYGNLCDVASSEVYAEKFDNVGNTIWTKKYLLPYSGMHKLAELSNSNLVITTNSNMLFTNSTGDSLSTLIAPGNIQSIAATPDGYILLGLYGDIHKMDLNGNYISFKSYTDAATKIIVVSDNEYIFSSEAVMYRTDSLFNVVDSNDLFLEISGNSIYDIEPDLTGFQLLGILDIVHVTNTFIEDSTYFDYTHNGVLQINDILTDGPLLIVAGDEHVKTTAAPHIDSRHPVIKSYDINYQTNIETNDAEVIDLYSDSVNVILTPFTSYLHFNLYATVKNNGPNTLTDLSLNFQIMPPVMYCDAHDISVPFSGLSLATNDTAVLYLGAYAFEKHLSPPALFNICVWSSAPNNRIDMDHSNDEYCKSFNPNYITGLEEVNPLDRLEVYPNPVSDQLQIRNFIGESFLQYSITDISGKECKRGTADPKTSFISVNELQPGIYFIRLEAGNAFSVRKICKM